ncbi:DNA alkylation repair protein [Polymorphospora sp. NPDC050346]|uniref:DNA alkylation repair protein n=1 Tax=Polymorphospora sp. NPDC050346 TaxID=3155780 RepID=UPI0033C0886D
MVDAAPPLASEVLARLTTVYAAAADPARGAQMAAYMRDRFPFLGIQAPARAVLGRQVLAGLGRPDEADLRAVAVGCWTLPEREYQYFACDWLRRHARVCSAGFLSTARELITTRSWWDTIDPLAVHLVGPLVAAHPELVPAMDGWIGDDDPWLVRTAVLHQLGYREATDAGRLFRYCVRQAGHPDFFVRKAIGWALREYARTDPEAVRAFVVAHRSRLAPLSAREALRNIG